VVIKQNVRRNSTEWKCAKTGRGNRGGPTNRGRTVLAGGGGNRKTAAGLMVARESGIPYRRREAGALDWTECEVRGKTGC